MTATPWTRRAQCDSMHPELHYLDFDFSDDESGRGSFDAMASVMPDRLPALLAEIGAVLGWAVSAFGPSGASEDEGEWGFELQGTSEPDLPLKVAYENGVVILTPSAGLGRTTLTFTLSGSAAFCEAFRERFKLI